MITSTQSLPLTNLSALPPASQERCDRCNAAAKLRVTLSGGSELVFCGHHANKYADDLVKIAVQYAAAAEFTWRGAEAMKAKEQVAVGAAARHHAA